MNQKGLTVPIVIFVILLLGLVVSLQLVKQTNIFKSKASSNPITYSGPNVRTDTNGDQYLTGNEVTIDLLSPFGEPQSRVLGVSTDSQSSFWKEFFDTFLISLHLKKAPPEQTKDKTFDASSLPVIDRPAPSYIPTIPTRSPIPISSPSAVVASPAPSNPPTFNSPDATLGFRIAESPVDLENKPFLVYSTHPLHLHYVFSSNVPRIKTIFAQFKSVKGNLSEVFSKSIELRLATTPSPTPVPIVEATASPSPTASPTPTPSASATTSPTPTPTPSPNSGGGGAGGR